MWNTYPSIFALGQRALHSLFAGDVLVEEKIDGSQFSFAKIDGVLRFRSKGAEIHPDAVDKLFAKAVQTVQDRAELLRDGWIYRAEYLAKPKHNVLPYARTTQNYLILFDVNTGYEEYLNPLDKWAEAERLGLEVVPVIHRGRVPEGPPGFELFKTWLDRESVLGGAKIEGVVFKNYDAFGIDKRILIGKFVSEQFKEQHKVEWKSSAHSGNKDILTQIILAYKTPARWTKAVQHLRDAGKLEGVPQDIGLLIREVPSDLLAECKNEIQEILWKWAWDHIRRGVTGGLPEWYKEQLAKAQFETQVEEPHGPDPTGV